MRVPPPRASRDLTVATAIITVALAACSFPEKFRDGDGGILDSDVDAATPFGCAGMPFPTTAPGRIELVGSVANLGTGVKANNATVTGVGDNGTMFFTETTNANGQFSALVETSALAIPGYVQATSSDFRPAYFYPGHPFDGDTEVPLPYLTMDDFGLVGNPPGTAILQVIMSNCRSEPLAGCILSVSPTPDRILYTTNMVPDPGATTTEDNGYALVYGAPAGEVTLNAACPNEIPLRTTTITMNAESTYYVVLEPWQ